MNAWSLFRLQDKDLAVIVTAIKDLALGLYPAVNTPLYDKLLFPYYYNYDYFFCSYELMIQCWDNDPNKRPIFKKVMHVLSSIAEDKDHVSNRWKLPKIYWQPLQKANKLTYYKTLFLYCVRRRAYLQW